MSTSDSAPDHAHDPTETADGEHAHEAIEPRVLLFYDYACPFCYVDQHRFDQLAATRPEVEFVLVPFELRPDMPDEGYQMSELEAAGQSEHVEEHLLRIAKRDGIPMRMPPFLPKTHKAHVLAEMGRDRGGAAHQVLHHAIFSAYFSDGKDIGDSATLLALAQAEGYEREAVERAWSEGTYDERLHQFRHLAMQLGVEATPAALICNELVIGSRPYEVLKESLDRCLVHTEALDDEGTDG